MVGVGVSFDEFALAEGCSGADEWDEVWRVDGPASTREIRRAGATTLSWYVFAHWSTSMSDQSIAPSVVRPPALLTKMST